MNRSSEVGQSASIYWNRAIRLQEPSAGTLREELGFSLVTGVFSNGVFFSIGSNVVFRIALGQELSDKTQVQAIGLALSSNFFRNAHVQTEEVGSLSVLGVQLPRDAQSVANELRSKHPAKMSLSTEIDRWVIRYGDAFSLMFQPLGELAEDPRRSRSVFIEFSYGLPYTARDLPTVSI